MSTLTQSIIGQINILRDYYYNYVYVLLMAQGKDDCSATINDNYQVILNSLETLYTYFKYYTIGDPRVLR